MRGKRIGSALVCALALMASALFATEAVAATRSAAEGPVLVLTERPSDTPLANGAKVYDEQLSFGTGDCLQESGGIVRSNFKPTDRLTFEAPTYESCEEEGTSVSGGVREVRISTNGEAVLHMNPVLSITTAGPCVYDFRKLTGSIGLSEIVYIKGVATGKRDRAASAKSCAHELTTEFAVSELGEDNYVLGAEVRE
jgi:hypothetical protein